MAVPTGYTNITFSDYLKNEVLIDTAIELGWLDVQQKEEPVFNDNPSYTNFGAGLWWGLPEGSYPTIQNGGATTGTLFQSLPVVRDFDGVIQMTATGNGTTTRGLSAPSIYQLPAGTVIGIGGSLTTYGYNNYDQFGNLTGHVVQYNDNYGYPTGETNRILASDLDIGDTSVVFTVALTDAVKVKELGDNPYTGDSYGTENVTDLSRGYFFYPQGIPAPPPAPVPDEDRVINPIYQSIIDQTLILMGKTDITTVTGRENVKKLRLFGRREAWKFAMQALAADYGYRTDAGTSGRSDVYHHCKRIYQDEDLRISMMYGEAREQSMKNSQYYTPTQRSKIKVRW